MSVLASREELRAVSLKSPAAPFKDAACLESEEEEYEEGVEGTVRDTEMGPGASAPPVHVDGAESLSPHSQSLEATEAAALSPSQPLQTAASSWKRHRVESRSFTYATDVQRSDSPVGTTPRQQRTTSSLAPFPLTGRRREGGVAVRLPRCPSPPAACPPQYTTDSHWRHGEAAAPPRPRLLTSHTPSYLPGQREGEVYPEPMSHRPWSPHSEGAGERTSHRRYHFRASAPWQSAVAGLYPPSACVGRDPMLGTVTSYPSAFYDSGARGEYTGRGGVSDGGGAMQEQMRGGQGGNRFQNAACRPPRTATPPPPPSLQWSFAQPDYEPRGQQYCGREYYALYPPSSALHRADPRAMQEPAYGTVYSFGPTSQPMCEAWGCANAAAQWTYQNPSQAPAPHIAMPHPPYTWIDSTATPCQAVPAPHQRAASRLPLTESEAQLPSVGVGRSGEQRGGTSTSGSYWAAADVRQAPTRPLRPSADVVTAAAPRAAGGETTRGSFTPHVRRSAMVSHSWWQ